MMQRAKEIVRELSAAEPRRIRATLAALACRVEVDADRLKISLSRDRLAELLAGLLAGGVDAEGQGAATPSDPADRLALEAPAALRRVGREMRLLIDGGGDAPAAPDPSLIRLLARAAALKARLIERPTLAIPALAREENLSPAYVYSLLRLAFLAPDIAGAILAGRKPLELNASRLMRLTPHLPPDWGEQRRMLGFG
jgi:site-specific DNA recombinase